MQIDNLTSKLLKVGEVYTRKNLREQFKITGPRINTGVFQPESTSSVWLFITEKKSADRTQYHDHLEGHILFWQGQMAGRTDALIINHQANNLELLVFYRMKRNEYPGAGFEYLGPFVYFAHSGSKPTNFILLRANGSKVIVPSNASDETLFDPTNIADARERISRSITLRRGQRLFRNDLIVAYAGKCAVTNCSVIDVLEAAHIHPYRGPDTNKVPNGLLLRSDIHTLFDCGLLAIPLCQDSCRLT